MNHGSKKCIFYVGADHALKSSGGTPGIATVVQAPVVILRNVFEMSEKREEFRILAGSEPFFHDEDKYVEFVDWLGESFTAVDYPMRSRPNPACDIWIEASPGANWSLVSDD